MVIFISVVKSWWGARRVGVMLMVARIVANAFARSRARALEFIGRNLMEGMMMWIDIAIGMSKVRTRRRM